MSHTEVYVLKSFPWSEDGYSEKHAEAHSTIDIPDGLFDGLNREGYVRRAVIGDGHVDLRPSSTGEAGPEAFLPLSPGGGIHLEPLLVIENGAVKLNEALLGDNAGAANAIGDIGPEIVQLPERSGADNSSLVEIIRAPHDATSPAPAAPTAEPPTVPPGVSVMASGGPVAAPEAPILVGEKASGTVVAAAPQPAVKTAALTEEEEQALADGTWKDLRFFAQRSIAAKLSDEPVANGEGVKRVIEAELARRKAEAL